MQGFSRWVLRWRWAIVVVQMVLTALSVFSMVSWLRVEADISKFLDEKDPVISSFRQTGDRFGSVAVAMVGVEVENVFSMPALELIDHLTRAFQDIPGVSWVVSLTNSDDVEKIEQGGEQGVVVRKTIRFEELKDAPALEQIKARVLSKERLVGSVVSPDGRLAQLLVHIGDAADRVKVAEKIEQQARKVVAERLPQARLYFAGFPFWMKVLSGMILEDLLTLVPVVTLVVVLVLLLSFRSLRGVTLPLINVLVSCLWAMGLMAALDIPITTLSNAVPVLLIALGTAYAIHLLHKYDLALQAGLDRAQALGRALSEVMLPVGMAGITTIVGFLSFYTSSLVFIRQTGLIAACGIFFAMVISLTLIPALLSWLPAKVAVRLKPQPHWGERLGDFFFRRGRRVLVVALLLAVACAAVLFRLDRNFNMMSYFPPRSEVVEADRVIKEKMGGSVPLWITAAGPIKDPYVLKTLFYLEKFLRAQPEVKNPISVAGLLAEVGEAMNDRLGIPDSSAGVGNLWLQIQGKDVLEQMVDRAEENALLQAVCTEADTGLLRRVVDRVEKELDRIPRAMRRVLRASQAELPPLLEERVGKMISYDLQAAGITLSSEEGEKLYRLLEEHWKRPVRVQAEKFRQRVLEYLGSDESEVEFSEPEKAERLADWFAQLTAEGRELKTLVAELRKLLADLGMSDDLESSESLATSLAALYNSLARAAAVEDGLEGLAKLLGREISGPLRVRLASDLEELLDENIYLPVEPGQTPEVKVELFQTGLHRVETSIDDQIVNSQLSSLGLAALVAMVLLMLQFRSVMAGLVGMIPMVYTLLVNFGVMAAFGVTLEPATVMIASLVVGVGIDYSIHFMARLQLEYRRLEGVGMVVKEALHNAGAAILINALTVACGMLVFVAGKLVPVRTFGLLLALAMVVSALSTLLLLPLVIKLFPRRFFGQGKSG